MVVDVRLIPNQLEKAKPQEYCPLCRTSGSAVQRGKPLYGVKVCMQCYNGFVNWRVFAFMIDLLLIGMVGAVLGGIAYMILSEFVDLYEFFGFGLFWEMLFVTIGGSTLMLFKDAIGGYSPGKLIMGLRVVQAETANRIGPIACIKRNLPVMLVFCILGAVLQFYVIFGVFLVVIIGGQCLMGFHYGDRWALTRVIWRRYKTSHVFVDNTLCVRCGYDLRATSRDECPECGEAISQHKRQKLQETYGDNYV